MNRIYLNLITGMPEQLRELQEALEAAPSHALRVTGHPPGPAEAQSNFTILPPGIGYEDKFVYGIHAARDRSSSKEGPGRALGCVDLIRGYPNRETAMLGLLLLRESEQGRGLGREAYRLIEERVRDWAGIEKIRVGVVRTNSEVLPFWEKMGFVATGESKPYRYDKLVSETLILEKPIASRKNRRSMTANLTVTEGREEQDAWPCRQIRTQDASSLGRLMERAYRDTIDDEGESVEQFIREAQATLGGKWGPLIGEASFIIEDGESPVSATVVTLWKDKPLLAYSVTDPRSQGKGMASQLIRRTMRELAALGHEALALGVTVGNPAERLYERLGFRERKERAGLG